MITYHYMGSVRSACTKTALIFCLIALAAGCSLWPRGASDAPASNGQALREDVTSEVLPRSEIPPYVGQIKSVRVYSYRDRTDTGIDLAVGKLYSIMAKGRVSSTAPTLAADRTTGFS